MSTKNTEDNLKETNITQLLSKVLCQNSSKDPNAAQMDDLTQLYRKAQRKAGWDSQVVKLKLKVVAGRLHKRGVIRWARAGNGGQAGWWDSPRQAKLAAEWQNTQSRSWGWKARRFTREQREQGGSEPGRQKNTAGKSSITQSTTWHQTSTRPQLINLQEWHEWVA